MTGKEKPYCEYVFFEQAKSVKVGLILVGGIFATFSIIYSIAIFSTMQGQEKWLLLCVF